MLHVFEDAPEGWLDIVNPGVASTANPHTGTINLGRKLPDLRSIVDADVDMDSGNLFKNSEVSPNVNLETLPYDILRIIISIENTFQVINALSLTSKELNSSIHEMGRDTSSDPFKKAKSFAYNYQNIDDKIKIFHDMARKYHIFEMLRKKKYPIKMNYIHTIDDNEVVSQNDTIKELVNPSDTKICFGSRFHNLIARESRVFIKKTDISPYDDQVDQICRYAKNEEHDGFNVDGYLITKEKQKSILYKPHNDIIRMEEKGISTFLHIGSGRTASSSTTSNSSTIAITNWKEKENSYCNSYKILDDLAYVKKKEFTVNCYKIQTGTKFTGRTSLKASCLFSKQVNGKLCQYDANFKYLFILYSPSVRQSWALQDDLVCDIYCRFTGNYIDHFDLPINQWKEKKEDIRILLLSTHITILGKYGVWVQSINNCLRRHLNLSTMGHEDLGNLNTPWPVNDVSKLKWSRVLNFHSLRVPITEYRFSKVSSDERFIIIVYSMFNQRLSYAILIDNLKQTITCNYSNYATCDYQKVDTWCVNNDSNMSCYSRAYFKKLWDHCSNKTWRVQNTRPYFENPKIEESNRIVGECDMAYLKEYDSCFSVQEVFEDLLQFN